MNPVGGDVDRNLSETAGVPRPLKRAGLNDPSGGRPQEAGVAFPARFIPDRPRQNFWDRRTGPSGHAGGPSCNVLFRIFRIRTWSETSKWTALPKNSWSAL